MNPGPEPEESANLSREFWDTAAREDAMWHIATGAAVDRQTFFASGRIETDALLAFVGISPDPAATLLEIGCGTGRMTARLAEQFGKVIALDVSAEMLARARQNLADRDNVEFVQGNGIDLRAIPDEAAHVVFSYIVLQHVPTVAAQLSYFRESRRVLKPGGVAAIQIRSNSLRARSFDLIGHLGHRMTGHRVFSRAWRGVRLPQVAMMAAASGSAVSESGPKATVTLKSHGSRHLWVVVHRQGEVPS